MRENSWVTYRKKLHARAKIHVGLKSEAAHLTYARWVLDKLVQRITYASSIVAQAGVYKGAGEPSAHVLLINAGDWALPWIKFKHLVRDVSIKLARSLAQKEVLVEYTKPGGDYLVEVYAYTTAGRVGPHSKQRVVKKLRALARRVRRGEI